MRTVTKEVQKIEKVTTYISDDGKEFNTKEECERWEKSYICTLSKSMEQIPHIHIAGDDTLIGNIMCDEKVWVVKPRNFNDINTINLYGEVVCRDKPALTAEHIGKLLVLIFGFDDDLCDAVVIQDYIQGMKDTYRRYEERIDNMEAKINE